MNAKKREINFIASQKLMTKQAQSTSFEFILVIAVMLLVVVMGTMFFMSVMNNKSAESELIQLKNVLESINKDTEKQKIKFAEFEQAVDGNGDKIILSTEIDKNGNIIYTYKWLSINSVATTLATQLENAKATAGDVKLQINLTSTIMEILFSEANKYDCTITSINYINNKMSISLLGPTIYSWSDYKDALLDKTNTATGLDNTKYIKEITGTNVDYDSTSGMNRFTISLIVISDNLYLVDDNGGM